MGKSKRKGEGQYAPLPYAQLTSSAWLSLGGNAVRVFLHLHTRYNGSNNGRLTLSYAEAAEALGMGKATVQRAFKQLVERGFLTLENPGNWYHRKAHEWRLTTKPMETRKGRIPATHDWRSWREGKTKGGSETEPSPSTVVPFENPSAGHGSKTEPVSGKIKRAYGSRTEH